MLTLVSLMFLNQKVNVIVIITKKITITFSPLIETCAMNKDGERVVIPLKTEVF